MIIDQKLLDELTAQAKESSKLRMAFDLRNSADDNSQRMLNAIEPGSHELIHRHSFSNETVAILRGCFQELFYNEDGTLKEEITLTPVGPIVAISVPKGQWHTARALESGTVVLTCKDGTYEPLKDEDILNLEWATKIGLHKRVVEFIDINYTDILEYGLMDDVLVSEYIANVDKLVSQTLVVEEKNKIIDWLDFMLKQMTDCANDNLMIDNKKTVFKSLIELVNDKC